LVTAASVIDVRTDTPRKTDRFFVDTNVWRYFTYAKFTIGNIAEQQRKAQIYSAYIQKCLTVGATLLWSPLSYSELSSVIERAELDIYNKAHAGAMSSMKDFRLGTAERTTVVAEVDASWGQICTMGTALPTPCDDTALAAAVALFQNYPLDGYDIFYVNAMHAANVNAVVTDDIDFTHVPNLHVFTANDKAIRQAAYFTKVAKTR
jgi:predicted nucleic acid-binding protein